MRARVNLAIIVITITIGAVGFSRVLADPGSHVPSQEGAARSGDTTYFFLDQALSTFPHVGNPIAVFNPNGRILRITPAR